MRSILMLGADPATVSTYRVHFERAGITVSSAEIVKPLVDFIRLAKPAAVLLDITRADTDGAHLVREIRSQREFTALPVFALAEKDSVASLSLATGGDSARIFWKSPIANVDLVEAVTEALNGTHQHGGGEVCKESSADNLVGPREGGTLSEGPANHASPADFPSAIRAISEAFRVFCATGESKRSESLATLLEQMRGLRRLFLAADQTILTAFVAALVRLTITLSKEGANVSASCLRTLSAAIDILVQALANQAQLDKVGTVPIRVLVLDDGTNSRRALQYALCSPELELVVRERSDEATESLRTGNFDVILADTRMLQDCDFPAQLRQVPNGKDIPLILLAAMPVLDARIQAFLNGGCDVIATPYAVSEVVVKAFTFALKRRLGQMVSNRFPIHLSDQLNLDADRNGDELRPIRVGLNESSEQASEKLEAVDGDSQISANVASPDLQRSEARRQDEVSTRQEQWNTNGSAHGRVPEPELGLNQAKTECQQSQAETAALRDSEQAIKNELKESLNTMQQLRETLNETQGRLDRQTTAKAEAEQELKRVAEFQGALEKKVMEAVQAEEQTRSALAAETQALRSELGRAIAERRKLGEQLSEMQKAKAEPASTTPPLNGSAPTGKSDDFQHKLDEISAFDLLTGELNQVRTQLLDERLHRQRSESAKSELEGQYEELTRKLEATSQRELALQQGRETLEINLRDSKLKVESVEASLQSASGECRRFESKVKDLEARLDHLSSQANIQSIVEESLRRRQAELTACVVEQRAEVAPVRTALAESQADLRRTKERVQTALSRVIQELDQEHLHSPPSADPLKATSRTTARGMAADVKDATDTKDASDVSSLEAGGKELLTH